MKQQLLIIGASACLLAACSQNGPHVDVAWLGDSLASPQNDTVIIESGQTLPNLAARPLTAGAPVASNHGAEGGWMSQLQGHPQTTPMPPATPPQQVIQQPVQVATAAGSTYVVRRGDTLSAIAARKGISTSALIAANGLGANPNSLRVGQTLRIPSPSAAVAAQANTRPVTPAVSTQLYVIKTGDTLSGIASRYGTTVSAIRSVNGFTAQQANQLRVGQTIKLPRR